MNNSPEPNRLRNQFEELFLELQGECMRLFASELLLSLYESGFNLAQVLYGMVDSLRSQSANEQLIRHLEAAAQYADLPSKEGQETDSV